MRKTNRLYTFFITTSLATFLALCLSLTACVPKSGGGLDDSLSEFRKALRWGFYDAAVAYIKTKNYDKPLRDRTHLKNIRITSYEYGGRRFLEDESTTEVLALISFYDVNRGSVVTLQEKQIWYLDPELNNWFLDGDIPDFYSVLQ